MATVGPYMPPQQYAPLPPNPQQPNAPQVPYGPPPQQALYPPNIYSQPAYMPPPGIAAPPVQQTLAVQQYLPLAQRHQLSPEDESAVQNRLQNGWYPKIMPGYSTPLHQMLANPQKKATLVGGITGAITAAGLWIVGLGNKHPRPVETTMIDGVEHVIEHVGRRIGPIGSIAIGGVVALLTGIASYFGTRQRNDNILDMMSRLPAGATRRDMLSDPVVQSDRQQAAMASGGGGFGGDFLTTMLLANAFSSGGSSGLGRGGSYRIRPSGGGSKR